MAFGQPSGPPATARQLRELTALVKAAGHADFRDARGPLGLTQRQAGGKFTQGEAEGLIARLEAEAEAAAASGPEDDKADPTATVTPRRVAPRVPVTRPPALPAAKATTLAEQLERVPERLLVAEMRRRGWRLVPPSPDS